MTVVIGLDLSRSAGYARWVPGQQPTYGTVEFFFGFQNGKLANAYDGWLRKQLAVEDARVYYEEPILPHKMGGAIDVVTILHGLCWHTVFVCGQMGLPCQAVNNMKWRRHFFVDCSGGRKKLKARAIEECRRRGFNPGTDDAADALGVLDYGADDLGIVKNWPQHGGALL